MNIVKYIPNFIIEYIKQYDNDFYESLKNLSLYAFPLESNTKLLPVTDVAHKMLSELHSSWSQAASSQANTKVSSSPAHGSVSIQG